MITKQTYALLSLHVYAADPVERKNKPLLPPNWTEVVPQPIGADGFAYAVYKNSATNEVVISFRGTDNDFGDWTANAGFSLSQEKQAAAVYARILRDPDHQGSSITFTGHSLGGGLTSIMGVWYYRPAYVFAAAPFQKSADSTQSTVLPDIFSIDRALPNVRFQLGSSADPALLSYVQGRHAGTQRLRTGTACTTCLSLQTPSARSIRRSGRMAVTV